MRKIIISEFVSLDGIFEDPGGAEQFKYGGWSMSYNNDEFGKFKYDELMASDALLLGRVTYEGFARAWPQVEGAGEFGEKMNSVHKYVLSTTLKEAEWTNSKIIKKDFAKEIARLKEKKGGDILVFGSGQLVRFLTEQNLVDQYNLLVYPVILGTGKRLFKNAHAKLKLIEAISFKTGILALKYEPVN